MSGWPSWFKSPVAIPVLLPSDVDACTEAEKGEGHEPEAEPVAAPRPNSIAIERAIKSSRAMLDFFTVLSQLYPAE
jgi:hypothetical protein